MCEKCICHDCIDRANCFRCDKCNDGNNKIKSCERRDKRELKQCKWSGYRDWETDRKSTRLNSSHITRARMPSSA